MRGGNYFVTHPSLSEGDGEVREGIIALIYSNVIEEQLYYNYK